jgi:D-beta-D-heptose 7-phosphate kinase/D-beta-D-heptose 1-phosphate adenosyltransferase
MSAPLVVVGDSLLDRDIDGWVERLSPDAPVPVLDEALARARPGGAALAAALAAQDDRPVVLVTALARDSAGLELGTLLDAQRVEVIDVGLDGATAEKIRFRSDGRPLMRLDRGGREARPGEATPAAVEAIESAATVLVSDYGRGMAAVAGLRTALAELAASTPIVWDPHPRGPAPVPGVLVATPNESEAHALGGEPAGARDVTPTGVARVVDGAAALRARWGAHAVCVTRGGGGALLVRDGNAPMAAPAPELRGGDACGAGDSFASSLALALADGAALEDAVAAAVARASAFVAGGGAESALAPRGPIASASGLGAVGPAGGAAAAASGLGVVERVRVEGGTVVATGGCFDLLHAGHVSTLEAARRLGDCLVVCLNSDESVRRLKGRGRPLVPERDRASVLRSLGAVDAVAIFGEDTPEDVLRRVRPHVWVKGGDYDGQALPEERVLREWGGRTVILPYVEGRSTTRLIEEASARG